MKLEQVNEQLLRIAEELLKKIPALARMEYAYDRRFYDLLLHSGMGNAQAREAEARTICAEEGLVEGFLELKADVRRLMYEKDCFIELGRNLRFLAGERLSTVDGRKHE